jgi:membrane-bound lytic murein transglycosylase A
MKPASPRATSNSRRIHSIGHLLRRHQAVSLLALLVSACMTVQPPPIRPPANTPPPRALEAGPKAVSFADLPQWPGDSLPEVWPAFLLSCAALGSPPKATRAWQDVCNAARSVDARDATALRRFFEAHFTPYQLGDGPSADTGLITGYYEPLLQGSRVHGGRFRYPLYRPPDDLMAIDVAGLYPELKDKRVRGRVEGRRVVPYWTRAEIESGKALLRGKEIVYVDDPIEAFFLQIQGSGRIRLAEGGSLRVGYADHNGHPYRSIGRVLVQRGEMTLEQASMQGIKQWAAKHPKDWPGLLNENPSYVFFREVSPDPRASVDGPIGTLGVPLLAQRTIAVDALHVPLGLPVFLDTSYPLSSRPLRRLVMAQDTGGAVRGTVRADFFWGFGDEAAAQAGRMKQEGRMWVLWLRGSPPPESRLSDPK